MDREEILACMSDDIKQYVDNIVDMYNAPFARKLGIQIVSLEKDTRERDWGRHRGRAEGEDGERPMAHVFPGSTAPGGPRTPPAEYPGEGRTGEGRLPARAD